MRLVSPYHTEKDPLDPVYHIYDDCPDGARVIKDGNANGTGGAGFRLCELCAEKQRTGHF